MDKYARTAAELLPFLGGADNIIAVTHCVTRIRISLADRHAVDAVALREHPAVLGRLDAPDAYHLIVGPAVAELLTRACQNMIHCAPGDPVDERTAATRPSSALSGQ